MTWTCRNPEHNDPTTTHRPDWVDHCCCGWTRAQSESHAAEPPQWAVWQSYNDGRPGRWVPVLGGRRKGEVCLSTERTAKHLADGYPSRADYDELTDSTFTARPYAPEHAGDRPKARGIQPEDIAPLPPAEAKRWGVWDNYKAGWAFKAEDLSAELADHVCAERTAQHHWNPGRFVVRPYPDAGEVESPIREDRIEPVKPGKLVASMPYGKGEAESAAPKVSVRATCGYCGAVRTVTDPCPCRKPALTEPELARALAETDEELVAFVERATDGHGHDPCIDDEAITNRMHALSFRAVLAKAIARDELGARTRAQARARAVFEKRERKG